MSLALVVTRLGAVVMLLLALGRHPYDFYTIMRWMVCGVCAYAAYTEFQRKHPTWGWALTIIAVAFNPIATLRLRRDTWTPIDLAVAGILLFSVIVNWNSKGSAE